MAEHGENQEEEDVTMEESEERTRAAELVAGLIANEQAPGTPVVDANEEALITIGPEGADTSNERANLLSGGAGQSYT